MTQFASSPLGLYVHVPFCSAICNYCNFNRGLFDAGLKTRYVGALLDEIGRAREGRADAGLDCTTGDRDPADTIYFGGGTPSLLEPDEIARLIGACREAFEIAPDPEITLEANPESVDVERLVGYRHAGVNRISFGVQSFRDSELTRLSRLHTADRAAAAVSAARAAGFDNLSLDLMMWLPGQSVREWLESVDRAAELEPEHLSLYLLEVYPNAPLREEMARARWSQAPDEDAAAMYVAAMERLERIGYRQYEISNLARPERSSRHNLKYWQDGEWLGFGCGAHSTRRAARWKNISSTEEYVARVTEGSSPAMERRPRTTDESVGDALFMGLRLTEGVSLDAIRAAYGVDVWQRYGKELEPFLQSGLLQRTGPRLRLSREGMLLAHEVMSIFV